MKDCQPEAIESLYMVSSRRRGARSNMQCPQVYRNYLDYKFLYKGCGDVAVRTL